MAFEQAGEARGLAAAPPALGGDSERTDRVAGHVDASAIARAIVVVDEAQVDTQRAGPRQAAERLSLP
jgi:hypothetical protein